MRIIQNNYQEDVNTTEEIICEHCNSVFEIDDNDITKPVDDDEYVYCPCCHQKVYLYEPNTKENIRFPTSYHCFENGINIKDDEIDTWVKECIEYLEKYPDEPYKYIGTGNSFAVVFNHEDEYFIMVSKNHFETYIEK